MVAIPTELTQAIQNGLLEVCDYVGVYPFYVTIEDLGFEPVIEAYNKMLPMPIWGGESHSTIWGSAPFNILFRALHDTIHMKYDCPFTLEGELKASRIQGEICDILGLDTLKKILHIETAEQALYLEKHGVFPPQTFTYDMFMEGIN